MNSNEIISCVVIDVFEKKSSSSLDDFFSSFNSLSNGKSLVNEQYLRICPRNSIVVLVPNTGEYFIIYPFFSAHISLPIKAGEHVWCFFPGGFGSNTLGYWMSKRTTDEFIDDTNFTFNSRSTISNYVNLEKLSRDDKVVENIYTSRSTDNIDYAQIALESSSSKRLVYEAIPRIKKKPSDFLVKGSHNLFMNFTDGGKKETATLIISAGRAQAQSNKFDKIINTAGLEENNKASAISGEGQSNSNEGEIDISTDKATIIVSENGSHLSTFDGESFSDLSLFFAKADEIRVIARENISIQSDYAKVSVNKIDICNASEPYVRYSDLKSVLKSLQDQIVSMASVVSTIALTTATTKAAEAVALTNTGLITEAAKATEESVNMIAAKAEIDSTIIALQPSKILADIEKVKSKKIFGE